MPNQSQCHNSEPTRTSDFPAGVGAPKARSQHPASLLPRGQRDSVWGGGPRYTGGSKQPLSIYCLPGSVLSALHASTWPILPVTVPALFYKRGNQGTEIK